MNKGIIAFVAFLLLFSVSCKQADKARKSSLDEKSTAYLLEQMKKNAFNFNTLSYKAAVSIKQEESKKSFKTTIRLKRDSAIWISISPALGIEVARVLIIQDTVKILNRLNKEYFIGDYSYLNKRFDIDLEFTFIQALLLGNPIDFQEDKKLKFKTDKDLYYIGNLRKNKANRADEKPERIEKEKEELMSVWLNPTNFKIQKFLFSDLSANRFITGDYEDYFKLEEQVIPKKLSFNFQSEKPSQLNLEYSRVELNKSLNFSFNIPSKYEQVYY